MSMKTNNFYDFADFRIDEKERVLIAAGEVIPLAPKVFDTLFSIVKRQGSIISKDELMEEVWADSFVEEGNLTQNIYTLRQTLGKKNKFIETVPRRGYRFVEPVKIISQDEIQDKFETKTPEEVPNTQSFFQSNKFLGALAVIVLGVLAIGAAAVWIANKEQPKKSETKSGIVSFEPVTDSGDILNLTVSPHGKLLAYVARDEESGKTLKLLDIQANQAVKLNVPEELNFSAITFSPDGDFLYFLNPKGVNQSGDVYRITRFGGDPKLVATDVWSEFSISPDGKSGAFYRQSPTTNQHFLIVKNLEENSDEKIIATRSFPDGFFLVSPPAWFPNGKKLIANVKPQKRVFSQLVTIDIETGKETKLETPELKIVVNARVLPNGENLVISGREPDKFSQVYKFSLSDSKLTRITNDVNNYRDISLSTDGKTLVAKRSSSFSNLWQIPVDAPNNAKQLTSGQKGRDARSGLEVLSNNNILYVSLAGGDRDLWMIDPSDKSRRQLTSKIGDINEHPTMSADGTKIYFDATGPEHRKIMRIDVSGKNLTEITKDKTHNDLHPAASPDGKFLYFIRQSRGLSAIWQKNLETGKEENLSLSKNINPQGFLSLSPNGKRLAFQQVSKKQLGNSNAGLVRSMEIGIVSLENRETSFFTLPTNMPIIRWADTNDAFDFAQNTRQGAKIWRQHIVDKEEKRLVLELPNRRLWNFVWSRDLREVYVSDGKRVYDAVLIKNF